TIEERIVELTRENGRLRREITYYPHLVDKVLTPLMPLLEYHINGLHSAVQKFNAKIERANSQWQAEEG
ncbi:hypothetical protein QBC46DRAFT_235463, partial [Diplogelasinospora grovesii]